MTTIYESCHHIFKAIVSVEDHPDFVKQERSVFTIYCEGILIDLSNRAEAYPDLVSNDYSFCQIIGKRLQKEGHPGILYASARANGRSLALFNPDLLSRPENNCFLTYIISTRDKTIRVERDVSKALLTIDMETVFGF